jgi:hypothetical protein
MLGAESHCTKSCRQLLGNLNDHQIRLRSRGFVLGMFVAIPATLAPQLSSLAFAQASDMAGIAHAESVSARAVVKTIDLSTRIVTLETSGGNTIGLTAGDQIRNLPQVRAGDTVIGHR